MRKDDPLAGYWEFPGGKVEAGETPEQAALRELAEEVGITATVVEVLTPVAWSYAHGEVRLHPFLCAVAPGSQSGGEVELRRWVAVDDLASYRFPPANDAILAELRRRLG